MESLPEVPILLKQHSSSSKKGTSMSDQMLKRAAVFDHKLSWYIPTEANIDRNNNSLDIDYFGLEEELRDVDEVNICKKTLV